MLQISKEYTISFFFLQIMLDNRVVRTIELDASLGSYIVTGLTHETGYGFSALLLNSAGKSATFTSRANTTIGELCALILQKKKKRHILLSIY